MKFERYMINPNWPSSFTYYGRYEDTGVTDRVYEYSILSKKRSLSILDIGCSSGIASKSMQKNLSKFGVETTITGLDVSLKIQKTAKENLNNFFLCDILKFESNEKFDIIICSKMLLYDTAKRKFTILSKCAKFLYDDGALVTDAHNYDFPSTLEYIKEVFKDLKEILWQIKQGPFVVINKIKVIIEFRKKKSIIRIMGKKEVIQYSESVLKNWKHLSFDKKVNYLFEIYLTKFKAYFSRNPNNKKKGKFWTPLISRYEF